MSIAATRDNQLFRVPFLRSVLSPPWPSLETLASYRRVIAQRRLASEQLAAGAAAQGASAHVSARRRAEQERKVRAEARAAEAAERERALRSLRQAASAKVDDGLDSAAVKNTRAPARLDR